MTSVVKGLLYLFYKGSNRFCRVHAGAKDQLVKTSRLACMCAPEYEREQLSSRMCATEPGRAAGRHVHVHHSAALFWFPVLRRAWSFRHLVAKRLNITAVIHGYPNFWLCIAALNKRNCPRPHIKIYLMYINNKPFFYFY